MLICGNNYLSAIYCIIHNINPSFKCCLNDEVIIINYRNKKIIMIVINEGVCQYFAPILKYSITHYNNNIELISQFFVLNIKQIL